MNIGNGSLLRLSWPATMALGILAATSRVGAAVSLIIAVAATLYLVTVALRTRRSGQKRRASVMLLVVLSGASLWIPVIVALLMPWLQDIPLAFYAICGFVLLGIAGMIASIIAVRLPDESQQVQ